MQSKNIYAQDIVFWKSKLLEQEYSMENESKGFTQPAW